jgi:D-alanyl-D-alanine carboxypeptidase
MESELNALVARGSVPGIQYVAVSAGRTLYAEASGWADLRGGVPMTAGTTMMAYSMSKTITAAAALQLVEAGALGLDDPLARWVPESPYGPAVTVRQLLAHTGGLPNPIPLRWVHPAAAQATFDEGAALAEVLRRHPRLAAPPGSRYAYSNVGYWLLGRAIERASGEGFASYVARRVLAPLGIPPAELGYEIPDSAHHAHGYLERWSFFNLAKRLLIDRALIGGYEGRWLRIADCYPNGPAFGGLVGTARAFATFLQDQLRPRSALFGETARRLFYEPQEAGGRSVAMTLGWHVGALAGERFFFKEGGGGGFHCMMRLYPDAGIGTVAMTNATGFDVRRCLDRFAPRFLRA